MIINYNEELINATNHLQDELEKARVIYRKWESAFCENSKKLKKFTTSIPKIQIIVIPKKG
jgi:hypothetical protein